jgi:hypothetical protein
MGLSHSPKIVTNGLVFAMDLGNNRSYRGPVVTNLLNQITNTNSSGAGISITSGTQEVFIPQLGTSTVKFSSIQNNYPAVSADCCPSPFAFSGGFTVTPSTLYTYGIVYKVESGYTNPNYMYRYEYTSNGGTYVTEGGVHNGSNRIHLGDGWYWAWGTFTTQATTNWIGYSAAFYYRYSTLVDKLYVAKVMLVQGDYTQLHPKYWPDVNTSRTNTTNLIDLTNTNSITTSLTYANNGTFSFNGSSNYIDLATNIQSGFTSATYEFWCRPTSLPSSGIHYNLYIQEASTWIALYNTGGFTFFGIDLNNGSGWFDNNGGINTGARTTSTLTANNFYHVCYTWAGGIVKVYLNGKEEASASTLQAANGRQNVTSLGAGTTSRNIGSRYSGAGNNWVGSIPFVKFYNKALSASEVQQNFNAHRGRYGI